MLLEMLEELFLNTWIVLAAATGILQRKDPTSLQCNGSSIVLKKKLGKAFVEEDEVCKMQSNHQVNYKLSEFRQPERAISP